MSEQVFKWFVIILALLLLIMSYKQLRILENLDNARMNDFLEFAPKGVDQYGRVEKKYQKVLEMMMKGAKL